ncbi:MAG: zinc-binding dehydrogenase [bacterium]|nr:zinc-binding dehydrogenase [bacterium]
MKAAFILEHGEADVIKYGELEIPRKRPGTKLIEVKACALNHLDIWVRKGIPAYRVSFPHVLGSDISGVDEDGKEVIVLPGIYCGSCSYCNYQKDNQCESYSIIGAKLWGGYAQYVLVPQKNVYPKPAHLDYVEAASMPLTFLTAYHMLRKIEVSSKDEVLIMGASSGVGVAAIQIAKYLGARVIAATGKKEKIERIRKIGADEVLLYEEIEKIKVDVVFEHTGGINFEKCIKLLKPYGRLITCGATLGQDAKIDIRYIFSKDLVVSGSRMGTKKEFEEVLELINRKVFRPIVDKVFELKEASKAHKYLEAANQVGKVVLIIS